MKMASEYDRSNEDASQKSVNLMLIAREYPSELKKKKIIWSNVPRLLQNGESHIL